MIGEMRDTETAQIAVQSALTGHLVLSTLHTNTAAGAITRLEDMGVERFLITAAVNGVLSQRLLRRLCDHCKKPVQVSKEMAEQTGLAPFLDDASEVHEAAGCDECKGTGYRGDWRSMSSSCWIRRRSEKYWRAPTAPVARARPTTGYAHTV